MIVINIALVILGILYGVGSVTNFKEWYYRHDYLAIMLSVFTSILLVVAGILNMLNWKGTLSSSPIWKLVVLSVTLDDIRRCTDWRYLNVIELAASGYKLTELQMVRVHYISFSFILLYVVGHRNWKHIITHHSIIVLQLCKEKMRVRLPLLC